LASSDQPNTQFLKVSRVQSIKTKILVFSLLATIIPSVAMGWFSYVQNRQFLSEKINQELKDVTSQASRELDLWLKERVYDIRVFSSSYVVSENLEMISRKNIPHIERIVALRRLKTYLKSVREKFVAYEELVLLCIGLCAYILSLTIVRPLIRLTQGADKVATGDLEVDVPARSRSEVGYLTQVFNHMVMRLREGREELAEANEAFDFIAERSVQIHGGIGTTREANIALFYRRAKTYESALGGTAHNFEKIADRIISEGLSM
jgi:HAMP domain-containing protein